MARGWLIWPRRSKVAALSACLNGYLNDKCCPPKHGKCIDPRRKDCAKMKPKCSRISEASCEKPCILKGGHSCCSFRIGGCHSCCAGGYLNDKCCPPGHGKCPASLSPL